MHPLYVLAVLSSVWATAATKSHTSKDQLCRMLHGASQSTWPCGDACYRWLKDSCDHADIPPAHQKIPVDTGYNTLKALGDMWLPHTPRIQANHGRFLIGASNSHSPCPSNLDRDICAALKVNDDLTMLNTTDLAVYVPDGQQIYIRKDGTLTYTQPGHHPESDPNWYADGIGTIYTNAGVVAPHGLGWLACRNDGDKYYHIRAHTAGVQRAMGRGLSCQSVCLVATSYDEGEFGFSPYTAYKYL